MFGLKGAEKYVNDNVMEGLIPSAINFKSFVDPFLIINPIVFAFPTSRMESQICFIPKSQIIFPNEASVGIPEHFLNSAMALSGDNEENPTNQFILSSLRLIDLCDVAHLAVENLFQYIFKLESYADANGNVDGYRFMQSYTSAWLIFSDFISASSSFVDYAKTNFSFTCLDKIANFVGAKSQLKEEEIWNKFFSEDCPEKIDSILRLSLRKDHNELYLKIRKVFNKNFSHLTGLAQNDVRVFRNLQHGAFLRRDQFERLFLNKSQGKFTVGSVFFHMYVIILSFSLDTELFIEKFGK